MIKELDSFWEYFWFIQTSTLGGAWIIATIFCSFFLCIFDWKVKVLKKIGYYYENKLVGLLLFNKHYNKITFLYVKPKYRNRNIATELINYSGCDVVRVISSSVSFWKGIGFTRQISSNIYMRYSE